MATGWILNLQSPHDQDMYQDLTQRFNRFDIVDQRTQGFGQSALNNGDRRHGRLWRQAGMGGGYGGMGGIGGIRRGQRRHGRHVWDGRHEWRRPEQLDRAVFASEPRHNCPGKTQEIPLREEFKGLSPEEIEALEATAEGEGKLNKAMVDALMARRRATIYVAVIRQHNQLLVRTSDEKTMEQIKRAGAARGRAYAAGPAGGESPRKSTWATVSIRFSTTSFLTEGPWPAVSSRAV